MLEMTNHEADEEAGTTRACPALPSNALVKATHARSAAAEIETAAKENETAAKENTTEAKELAIAAETIEVDEGATATTRDASTDLRRSDALTRRT
jgi:predicted amino acid racemase